MNQLELNGRTYAIAAIIMLGLLFEALKLMSFHPARTDDGFLGAKPYAISERAIHHVTKSLHPSQPMQPIHVQIQTAAPAYDMKAAIDKWKADQTKQIEQEKLKKAAAKGWHWVWNKKTSKWEWKKKKKKKKPAAASDNNVQTAITDTTSPNPAQTPTIPSGAGASVQAGKPLNTFGSGFGGGAVPNKFLTMQEWENLLLKSANPSATAQFVAAYKQHVVSEPMFYQIVKLMLQSNSVPVQQQGVWALSQTPSVESFDALANESQTLQTSSPLAQSVNQALAQYASAGKLSILRQVLTASQTAQVLIVALNQLQSAVQALLPGAASGGPTASGGANAAALKGFIPALTVLSTNANANVAGQASNLLHELQGLG